MLNFFKKLFSKNIEEELKIITLDDLNVYIDNYELNNIIALDILYNSTLSPSDIILKKLGFPIIIDTNNCVLFIIQYNGEQLLHCKVKLDQLNFGSELDGIVTTNIRFKVKELIKVGG